MHIRWHWYTAYSAMVFMGLGLVLTPFFWLICQFDPYHRWNYKLNTLWARWYYILSGIPYKIDYEESLDPKQAYVFCPNHFSFLDIPSAALGNIPVAFMGKKSLAKMPVVGFTFKRSHILVDRRSARSKANALKQSMELLEKGISLVIFPEGGIVSNAPPQMGTFKDGAFRSAIEKQIPIVPVSILYNWIILPDQKPFRLNWHEGKIIYHKPIPTVGYGLDDIESLKDKTYQVIHAEMKKIEYANRQGDLAQDCAPGQA
jgi:1-acyl-sn-glycerol-3-phosphate acyltransferase